MPFKSEKQRKWMHANEPEMADKWEKEEESVNNEADLGLTYKKGKTVKVTHKTSGKELIVIDKPNVRKKYEKIGYFAEGKLNEVSDKDVESYVKKKGLKGMDLPFWKVGITYPFYPTKYHYVRAATAKLAEKQLQKMYNRESGGKFGKAVFDDNYFLKVNKNLKEDRDYKAEYKKFQSSTKSKKYRAELNKYNRQKGTYGNGDKKDASHKGGKIVGFEAESKNRGRAEKSRLKKEAITMLEAKFTDSQLASRISYHANLHKGTGVGYANAFGQLAIFLKDIGYKKSFIEAAKIMQVLAKKKKVESVNEGGMGILSTDQADVLQGIVMRNKSKNLKAILSIVIKDKMFKGVDKKELLGYIDGARQFVKYMKSNPMESVNEAEMIHVLTKDIGKKKMNDLVQFIFNVLDLAPNKDFRLSSNGKILSVNVDKINSKSIQNIKKRYGVDLNESINEAQSLLGLQVRAIEIAINMAGNMTGAVKKIEKIKRGLSKDKKVADVLRKMNESVNESAVSFWQDMFRPGPIPKKYIMQLIKKKGELPSKSHIKKIYKDNGNPSSSELAKSWKQLTKEKYVRAASGMWRWNADFTGWESVNEKKIVNSPLRKNITSTFKDLDKKFPKKFSGDAIKQVASYITSKNRYFPKGLADIAADYFYDYKRGKLKINQAIQGTLNFQRGYPYKHPRTGEESIDESGILYKAGVKKYGKEGMAKILSAAGKKKSHAEIGAIKDKYEKDKKESTNEGQTQSIDGKDLLDFLMKRFKMSKSKAIATMKKQKMDLSFLKKESVNEEIMNWQGGYDEEFKFKKGQLVKDINPDCPHVGSEGEVIKVTEDEVTYIVRNNGKNYKVGDELTKTKDQLTPLSIEEKLRKVIRREIKSIRTRKIRKENIWDQKKNINKLKEGSTIPGAGGRAHVDDGPRYWWGDRGSYESHQDKIAGKLGWEVVNWIMKKNTKMWGNADPRSADYPGKFDINLYRGKDVNPGGPTGAVSYAPTGIIGKKGGTQVFQVDNMAKGFSLWEDHIKFILKNLGWEIIDYMGAENVLMNTVPPEEHPDDTPHDRKSEKGKVVEAMTTTPLAYSSSEAQKHVDRDVIIMSKFIGKASQQVIKTMMDGVKSGRYDAMDLQRGFKYGSVKRTHFGEMDFIQQLWRKVRDGFRRYSKDRKLR